MAQPSAAGRQVSSGSVNKHDLPEARAGGAHDHAASDVDELQKSASRHRLLSGTLLWLGVLLYLAFWLLPLVEGRSPYLALVVAASIAMLGSAILDMRTSRLDSRLRTPERSLRAQLRSEARSDAIRDTVAGESPR